MGTPGKSFFFGERVHEVSRGMPGILTMCAACVWGAERADERTPRTEASAKTLECDGHNYIGHNYIGINYVCAEAI